MGTFGLEEFDGNYSDANDATPDKARDDVDTKRPITKTSDREPANEEVFNGCFPTVMWDKTAACVAI